MDYEPQKTLSAIASAFSAPENCTRGKPVVARETKVPRADDGTVLRPDQAPELWENHYNL